MNFSLILIIDTLENSHLISSFSKNCLEEERIKKIFSFYSTIFHYIFFKKEFNKLHLRLTGILI